jgi:predicted metal-dependent hydrolase
MYFLPILLSKIHDFTAQNVYIDDIFIMKRKKLVYTRLKDEAKDIIVSTVDKIAREHGFKYNQIRVKNQKTRLGSCSTKKNLNFNWQIAKFPQEVMEYVVKHELAHLRHPNHSNRYWREVERIDPQYKKHHNWIKEHAYKYMSFS